MECIGGLIGLKTNWKHVDLNPASWKKHFICVVNTPICEGFRCIKKILALKISTVRAYEKRILVGMFMYSLSSSVSATKLELIASITF